MTTLEQAFTQDRPRLFAVAYRMLGSASEAEDVLQEAYLRARNTTITAVHSPGAFFAKIVTRLCIDYKRSARARRESYVGPWLPEPIETRTAGDPVERAESISQAFLVVLENLSPLGRAAYLLREVFGYEYREIAAVVDRDEGACRQLVSRAKRDIEERKPRFAPSREAHHRLVEQFAQTLLHGNVSLIEAMLSQDVTALSDGGGMPGVARKPIVGRAKVALFFKRLGAQATSDFTMEVREVNGWPALLGFVAGRLVHVLQIETDGVQIVGIRSTVNPEKLRFVGRTTTSSAQD